MSNENLSFTDAVDQYKKGQSIKRKGWDNVYLKPCKYTWSLKKEDFTSDDWEIVNDM